MNQDAIWDYFQHEGVASFDGSKARLSYLVKKIAPGTRVLNIGVGSGIFEKLGLSRGIDIHCIDPSKRTIDSLRRRLGIGEKARVGYSQEIPFGDHYFDGVVMSEVLEHLTDDVLERTIVEVHRVLAAGGHFIGTVPARENLLDQATVCPCCGNKFHRWGHLQTFDPSRLRYLIGHLFEFKYLTERTFHSWNDLNWKGKVHGFIKSSLRIVAGIHGSGETIFFMAARAATPASPPQRGSPPSW